MFLQDSGLRVHVSPKTGSWRLFPISLARVHIPPVLWASSPSPPSQKLTGKVELMETVLVKTPASSPWRSSLLGTDPDPRPSLSARINPCANTQSSHPPRLTFSPYYQNRKNYQGATKTSPSAFLMTHQNPPRGGISKLLAGNETARGPGLPF